MASALALPLGAFAEDLAGLPPEERGYRIMERSDLSDAGFGSSTVDLTMTLTDGSGRSTVRNMQIDTLEKRGNGNGDKSLTRFFSPPDVEGTALLSHARILDPDDQWLYLPGLRRVKRISSSNKSGPFVGSEFAFEDLTANELGKYAYRYLETVQDAATGLELDVVECKPLYERSGYSKLHCYVDAEIHQSRRVEFFDRGGRLFKTLELLDYRQSTDGFWRAHEQVMTNHLTGKATTLRFGEFEFGISLNQRDFEPSILDRL
ncbi:outer membrane lipoprotein-sorting protein [Denitrobaculum tricleocarpae]|uniref:Outer membrane lipoprotein-sorting protein n=2 Tax=Denitrobaculum tricleocarpae TaxID=2591009 RepID=A0A545TRW6_9PROT|nr:outer membrane lipoprotein-sorting protein [Denitrobaculum tricleocarpae]